MLFPIRQIFRRASASGLLAVVCLIAGPAEAATDIRAEPGGPRLYHVDGPDVRTEPGGRRLLFIDENTIRPEPGGPRFLIVQGNDIRAEPGGVRLAFLDDASLRRTPDGPPLLIIKESEIRSVPDGPPLLILEGAPLTKPQLAAVLYQWKRELFRLSEAELARLKAELAAGQGSDTASDAILTGKFTIRNSSIATLKQGTATIAKQGEYYSLEFDFTNGNKLIGIGIKRKVLGADEIWTALSSKGAVAVGAYELGTGTNVSSRWFPYAALTKGDTVLGNETMTGPASFSGEYTISMGQATNGNGTFSGTLRLAGFPKTDSSIDLLPRELQWTIGSSKITGIGTAIEVAPGRLVLTAASSSDPLFAIGRLAQTSTGEIHLEFCTNGKAMGYVLIEK